MAYPGELEDQEYKKYVMETQGDGQAPLPKDQWRMQKQQTPQIPQTPVSPEALSIITNALMRRRM